tara:strand:- start:376 stop:648 length:273 start_codon:yes stop_codon:yes gene_type:complete
MRIDKTDLIYRVALTYACFKSGPKKVDDNLLRNMFKDLCLLSDEYAFDYKQELKNILTESENIILCDEQKLYDNNYITQGQLNKLTKVDQ